MNRRDVRSLSDMRLADAQALLVARRYSAAHSLAGHAVECALKACIATQTRRHDFPPDPRSVSRIYTHRLETLIQAADLRASLDTERSVDPQFDDCWSLMAEWSEQAWYRIVSQAEAGAFFTAASDPHHGVLQWLRHHW